MPHNSTSPADIHAFEHHWQDEADAAFLYRALASVEPDARKRDVYTRLAQVEPVKTNTENVHPPRHARNASGPGRGSA